MYFKSKDIDCFNVSEDDAYSPGVYKIEDKNYVYIGSTIKTLSNRFLQHYNNDGGNSEMTSYMLHNGGDFTCLISFEPDEYLSEKEVRDYEARYIRLFQDGEKILLNKKIPHILTKQENCKCTKVQIPIDVYDDIKKLLKENGYLLLGDAIYNKKFDPLNDFDDFATIYHQPTLTDYVDFPNMLSNDDNCVFETCNVESIKFNSDDGIYMLYTFNNTVNKYVITYEVYNYIGFKYYDMFECFSALEDTIPNKVMANDKKIKDSDIYEWFYKASELLKRNSIEE